MENFNVLVSGGFQAEDLVNDAWTDLIRKLLLRVQSGQIEDMSREGLAGAAELADFEKMNEIRARVEAIVRDPGTAEQLKPFYRQFCKRPTFNDDYLATFNRPNVRLVDTAGKGVERITKKGVVVGGVEYALDCLIFSTGFEVGTDYTRRSGYDLIGRDGLRLSDKWSTGVRTLHGMFSRGFPNCFIMGNAQTGFTANYPHMLDEQTRHIVHVLGTLRQNRARRIEAAEQAEQEWVETVIRKARLGEKFFEECTPGYYNNEGDLRGRSAQNGFYGGGSPEFFRILEEWRADGRLSGLDVT
jgi:cyclohexanone monooxygenase